MLRHRFHRVNGFQASTDEVLVDAALRRLPGAWDEVIRRFQGLVWRCVARTLARRGREEVCDVVADVWLNLLRDDMRKLRAWEPARGTRLSTWLGLIAAHTAYDFLRAVSRRPELDSLEGVPEPVAPGPSPLEQIAALERGGRVLALVQALSLRDRQFIELYFGRNLPPGEIARALGISLKTVYTKKHKIRARLVRLAGERLRRAA